MAANEYPPGLTKNTKYYFLIIVIIWMLIFLELGGISIKNIF